MSSRYPIFPPTSTSTSTSTPTHTIYQASTSYLRYQFESMKVLSILLLTIWSLMVSSETSVHSYYEDAGYGGYGDEGDGDYYNDYAEGQQMKLDNGGGGVLWKVLAGSAVGWFAGGKYQSNKVRKALQAKHKKEQKELYTKYYNDIYQLQDYNAQLTKKLKTCK